MTDGNARNACIAGQRVLITGGTTGMGRATVLALVREGASVLTFGRHQPELTETLSQAGLAPAAGLTADASRREDVDRVFAAVDERLGGLDVLIACAALGAQPIHEMTDDNWRYVVETNLMGYMACVRAAVQRMLPQGRGHIVLVSSISPKIMAPGESVYAATKGGVNSFALTLRKEVADQGIRISLVEPGSTWTEMQECSDEDKRAAAAKGEMLFAEEIAEAILFILSRSDHCDIASLRIEPIRQKWT
jgi:3-hydroxy acid dehydrogenase / malonic semialdehyde reductase